MGRTQNPGVALARPVDVVSVVAVAREEPVVLDALDGNADPGVRHVAILAGLQRRREWT